MGPGTYYPIISTPGYNRIVIPYGSNTDTTGGTVRYTNKFISPVLEMDKVKRFIRYQSSNNDLLIGPGAKMLVVEWGGVTQPYRDTVSLLQ